MMKRVVVVLFALGLVAEVSAHGPDILARFDGAIGVDPVTNVLTNPDGTFQSVIPNIVRGVRPAPGPWRIADLRAEVDADGHIKVRGRGLLLANGNRITQNANQSVFATLICEATVPFVERSTAFSGVPLGADGDFRIDDVLNPAPPDCPSPVLLIRSGFTAVPGNPVWFAVGIPKLGDD